MPCNGGACDLLEWYCVLVTQAGVIAGMVASGWFDQQAAPEALDDLLSESCLKVRSLPHKLIIEATVFAQPT